MRCSTKHRLGRRVVPLLLLGLGGCAGAGGYGAAIEDPLSLPATSEIARRTGYAAYHWLRPAGPYMDAVTARIDALRKAPMSEAAAVEVALLNDPAVQARLQEHDALRAGFVRELATLAESGAANGGPSVEWRLVGRTIVRPRFVADNSGEEGEREPVGIWDRDFAEGYLELAATVLAKAEAARQAWYDAVAAGQLAALDAKMLEAGKAAAELANEQYRAGTLSRLDQAREQLAYAETHKEAAEARQRALEAREALNRELLLHGAPTTWALPELLPELPPERPVIADPEALVLREGIEAVAARGEAGSFGKGVVLRSEAREAYAAMLVAYDLARFQRDAVLPASRLMLEEQQLHYNAMLEDVYDLLAAARERTAAEREAVEAVAEFWKARARFARLAGGRLPAPPATTAAAATTLAPSAGAAAATDRPEESHP